LGLAVSGLAATAAAADEGGTDPDFYVKPALLLQPGWTDPLGYELDNPTAFNWTTSDSSTATVTAEGEVTAVAVGDAVITVAEGDETVATVPVSVVEKAEQIGESFMTAVMWAPELAQTTDEQYRLMAEGGIDVLQNQSLAADHYLGTGDRAGNLLMAQLAAKYGMQVLVADDRLPWDGSHPPTETYEQIADFIQTYRHVPGVGGMNFVDEAEETALFAPAYLAAKDIAPEWFGYVNFCPLGWCGAERQRIVAWLEASGGVRDDIYSTDYLQYDYYYFNRNNTGMAAALTNMNAIREYGLQYNIKTGAYVNLMQHGSYRQTTPTDLTWQANVQAAYGFKALWYFCWQTPLADNFTFGPAVIDRNGELTAMYEPVKQTNAAMHALGPTLMRLDAQEVYLAGNRYSQTAVPSDFFVQPRSTGNLVLSHMVDRHNGDEYLFVVNNSELGNGQTAPAAQDITLDFADDVVRLAEVSRVDGTQTAVALTDQTLERHLDSAEGVLYRVLKVVDSDKDALEEALAETATEAAALDSADFTFSSWAALEAALADGQAVLDDLAATQDEVDAAVLALGDALDGLLPALNLNVTVTPRCVAGKVYLYASVKNNDAAPANVTLVTAYGSKDIAGVTSGRSGSASFTGLTAAVDAGQAQVKVAEVTGPADFVSSVSYPAFSCV
jgi:hypothetical protein